jgi:chromosome partitioning protein
MIVAFAGQKGGTGKSTLACCAAAELAARGKSVLLVDSDPQKTATTWNEVGTEAREDEASKKSAAPSVVAMTGGTLHQDSQVPKLANAYDHVIIDTPGRIEATVKSALMVADVVALPCEPSPPDVWALAETIKLVEAAQEFRARKGMPKLRAAIVINRKRAGTVLGEGARKALNGSGLPVLKTEIGLRQSFKETLGAGLGITSYAPSDAGAEELRALVDELLTLAKRKS